MIKKYLTSTWFALTIFLLLQFLVVWDPAPMKVLRYQVFDAYQNFHTYSIPDPQVILIDIDEKTLKELGQFPFKRTVNAELTNRLGSAKTIAWALLFPEEDRLGGDYKFSKSLERYNTVIGSSVGNASNRENVPSTVAIKGDANLYRFPGLISSIEKLDSTSASGVMVVVPEVDTVVRRMPMIIKIGFGVYANFVLQLFAEGETIKAKAKDGDIKIKAGQTVIEPDSNGNLYFKFAKPDAFVRYSAVDVLNGNIDPAVFEGKIVIIGITAAGLTTINSIPTGTVYDHDIYAHAYQSILDGEILVRPGWSERIELTIMLVFGLMLLLLVPRLKTHYTVLLYVIMTALLAGATNFMYVQKNLLLNPAPTIIFTFLLFAHLIYNKFIKEYRLKQQIKKQFGTYISPDMVKKLQKDPSLLKLGGDTKDMTFLFCDIRGFTPVSEQYKTNPQGLTELVNRFLTPMTDVIMLKGGTIDKYMGDCIMAFWNAPLDVKNHRQLAIETALRMQDKLKILNLELANEKKLPINIGIGINSGEVVVGNMGSNQRFDYSVLGDAVNLAARLEGQSKSYGVKLIVGEDSTKDCIDQFNFIPLDTIAVKGKTEPVNIYTVMKTNDDTYRMKNSMTEAIGQYKLRKWKIAQKLFRSIKISHPELAIVSQLYINRCELYSKAPPPKDWDGTFIAQTK